MFTVVALFFKGFLSGALNVLRLVFSDWRILLAVILLALAGFTFYKWNGIKKELAAQQAMIEQTKQANAILENNNKVLHDANVQSGLVIEQVKKDQQKTLVAVKKLNTDLANSSKKIGDLKGELDKVKAAPVPLSPFISEAINGIQKMGDTK